IPGSSGRTSGSRHIPCHRKNGSRSMFTGIVQGLGTVASREPKQGDEQLTIDFGDTDLGLVAVGDSVSVSGVCLTATAFDEGRFVADVSRETLSLTTLGGLEIGDRVNL